jgi:Domain of unknown function (DUF1918)
MSSASTLHARKGDWIEVNMVGGGSSRRGQILEVLGAPGHEHFRVRWDEQHESLGIGRVTAHPPSTTTTHRTLPSAS